MTTEQDYNYYEKMLGILGSLTSLYSESNVPFLNYRVTENLFCKVFNAENLSRSDVSADAIIDKKGIGIKTFVNGNGKTLQKVAEFNKDNANFRRLAPRKLIEKIADLRNERIETTKRIYNLNSMIYHCIVRDEGIIKIFESNMDTIDKSKIKLIKSTKNTISFKDNKNEYSFNITKSTLYKRFITQGIILKLDVTILKNPFKIMEEKFQQIKEVYYKKKISDNPFVILPLYSTTKGEKIVQKKSGLNQWNARGRKRDINEIYIPISKKIHKRFPGFFLPRNSPFSLILPDGAILKAKICQDGSKALMSKHNADLGKWLLRTVLNLKEKELLTYKILQKKGFDSVMVERIDNKTYSINFKSSGTYEKFVDEND